MREHHTLLHRLLLWAEDTPDEAAFYSKNLDQKWQTITVLSFVQQVARIATALRQQGMKSGDRVVIFAKNSPEWIEWELGVQLAGGISVGIHPSTPAHDLKHILPLVDPFLIVVEDDRYRKKMLAAGVARDLILEYSESLEWLKSGKPDAALVPPACLRVFSEFLQERNPDDQSMLVFTSGTTGAPRGVQLGQRQLMAVSDRISREWNLPYKTGVLFSFLPLAHIAEKVQSMGVAITNRYPVWFSSDFDLLALELKEVRPTMMLGVPRVWERIKEKVEVKRPRVFARLTDNFSWAKKVDHTIETLHLNQVKSALGFDRLTLAVSGAAKLPPSICEWFDRAGISMYEIYGMSETCGLITMTETRSELMNDASVRDYTAVGRPPHGVEVKIERNGEIWVKADHCFTGYFLDPEETARVLVDGWLKTGDLGEWTSNGELRIIGRDREIIKLSNGRMIAPVPIENALKEIPEVSNACVVGEGRNGLLALITLKEQVLLDVRFVPGAIEGVVVESEDLRKKIRAHIDALVDSERIHESIKEFIVLSRDFLLEEKEITPTQKLNRRRIQEQFRYFIEGDWDRQT